MKSSMRSRSRRGTGEARPSQGLRDEGAEPDLRSVEPGRMGGNEVQMHVSVPREPAVVLWFLGVEVVDNDMYALRASGLDIL